MSKYKEKLSYDCEFRKGKSEDLLCTIIKYNILSYPTFIFVLFDMNYEELEQYKQNIYNMTEDVLFLNFNLSYKMIGIITVPEKNHYNTIIFNPIGITINQYYKANYIYYHDGLLNNGKITVLNKGEDWRHIGIPYIIIYKKINE